ncbi:hypothetical protein [Paenibacillus amylolyticus]|uniref:hypothetical protein n=1 Tax=Paenibacillus amylolyticus TaxID=1451 RepID=UPI003D2D9503
MKFHCIVVVQVASFALNFTLCGYNEEIAHTVTYLMANTFTTGSTLYVDGGYTLI